MPGVLSAPSWGHARETRIPAWWKRRSDLHLYRWSSLILVNTVKCPSRRTKSQEVGNCPETCVPSRNLCKLLTLCYKRCPNHCHTLHLQFATHSVSLICSDQIILHKVQQTKNHMEPSESYCSTPDRSTLWGLSGSSSWKPLSVYKCNRQATKEREYANVHQRTEWHRRRARRKVCYSRLLIGWHLN